MKDSVFEGSLFGHSEHGTTIHAVEFIKDMAIIEFEDETPNNRWKEIYVKIR